MPRFVFILIVLTAVLPLGSARADNAGGTEASGQHADLNVMQAFAAQQSVEGEAVKISDKEKHQWLFIMGATLLILLLTTAMLGIAMGVFGKQVFVAHMITAGLSVTLAVAHAVAAFVWFNPF